MVHRHYDGRRSPALAGGLRGAAADRRTPSSCWSATCTAAWSRRCATPRRCRRRAKAVYVEIGPRADAAARGEVGQVGAGHAARRADARPTGRCWRRSSTTSTTCSRCGAEPRGDDRDARVHPGPLVAAPPPQPDRAAHQGRAAVPQGTSSSPTCRIHLKQLRRRLGPRSSGRGLEPATLCIAMNVSLSPRPPRCRVDALPVPPLGRRSRQPARGRAISPSTPRWMGAGMGTT